MAPTVVRPILVICPLPPPTNGQTIINQRIADLLTGLPNVRVVNTSPSEGRGPLVSHASRIWRVLSGLRILLLSEKPGTLYQSCGHALSLVYTVCLSILARLKGARIVLHHHSFSYIEEPSSLMRTLVAAAGRDAIHVVLCTCMADRLRSAYPGVTQTLIVSNFFGQRPRHNSRPPRPDERPSAGILGNLDRAKGLHDFLELACQSVQMGLSWNFVLAGPIKDPSDQALLETAVRECPGRVHWIGPVYGAQKDEFYRNIDLFVFPTQYAPEAQPLVLVEAVNEGVPFISVDRGCIGSDFGCEAGIAIPRDRDFVAEAIQALDRLQDPVMLASMKRASTELARRKHEQALRQLFEFQQILAGGPHNSVDRASIADRPSPKLQGE